MLYVGPSGWSYKDWGKKFYPEDLPAREQLGFMAKHFPTVEVNATFYRLPAEKTFQNWYDRTPPEFRFAIKASRIITHIKRLNDVHENWQALRDRSRPLAEKLGVYLLQFPPSFRADDETRGRLEQFLTYAQEPGVRLAFEMRHASWFEPATLKFLTAHNVILVRADSSRYPHTPPEYSVGDFAYYRLHGPRQLYASQYSAEELAEWSEHIRADLDAGRDVYVYFDNDVHGYALEDARALTHILESQGDRHQSPTRQVGLRHRSSNFWSGRCLKSTNAASSGARATTDLNCFRNRCVY